MHRLLKDNVAQVVVLERTGKGPPAMLCVANTHMHWNPEYADVKLWQTHTLIKELEEFVLRRGWPLVLCGDFNSEPDSSVYQLLTRRRVSPDHVDLSPAADPQALLPPVSALQHRILLQSAYASLCGGEPTTNVTKDFKGCLDYVFYTSDTMVPIACQEIADDPTLQPTPQHSSDHSAHCVDLILFAMGSPAGPIPRGASTSSPGLPGPRLTMGVSPYHGGVSM
jgi:CCR4-NOT transcription complex subunit 6